MLEVVGSILGLLIIIGVMVIAIRLLRQPRYRYEGDPTPQGRRSFRETMVVWLMGRRETSGDLRIGRFGDDGGWGMGSTGRTNCIFCDPDALRAVRCCAWRTTCACS